MSKKVDAVIPTYNDSRETLKRSIQSALNQTIDDLQVIVVDDDSKYDTKSIIEEFDDERLYFISLDENKGGSAARNTGANASTGEYIAFLDADDEWLPSKLDEQINYLQSKDEDWVACYCDADAVRRGLTKDIRRYILESGMLPMDSAQEKHQVPREGGEELVPILLKLELSTGGASTILVKRDAFEDVGGFDESFLRHQDFEFFIRLAKYGKVAYFDKPLVRKYESDPPKPATLKIAKEKYISEFSNEIKNIELEHPSIKKIHYHDLGENYLRHGYLFHALKYMDRDQLQIPIDLILLTWSYILGVINRISGLPNAS